VPKFYQDDCVVLFTCLATILLDHFSVHSTSISEASTSSEDVRKSNLSVYITYRIVIPYKRRVANTCGDPSLATTYYEAFSSSFLVHDINTLAAFINSAALDDIWQIIEPSFKAWDTPGQPGTTPLHSLFNPTTTDFVYLTSNGTAPTLSRFQAHGIIGYVYATQICGSIPLYAASGPNDHWYTTSLFEHNKLIGISGWSDDGVAVHVLSPTGLLFALWMTDSY